MTRKIKLLLLCCTLAVAAYWTSTLFVKNVYHFAFVGAVYEILWLPMLALLVILPVVAFVFWKKERFNLKSIYIMIITVIITVVLMLNFK